MFGIIWKNFYLYSEKFEIQYIRISFNLGQLGAGSLRSGVVTGLPGKSASSSKGSDSKNARVVA